MDVREVVQMLNTDIGQVGRVVRGTTPDLGIRAIGPDLIRHLQLAVDALESS